jgi:hypothetical protein
MKPPISVYFADAKLARTLGERLAAATGRRVDIVDDLLPALESSGPLVTSTTQCSPVECAGMTDAGRRVIILAAVPSAFQEELYGKAGASAYLPMSLDLGPLVEAIGRLEPSIA